MCVKRIMLQNIVVTVVQFSPVCFCYLISFDDKWYFIIFNILSLRLLKKVKCYTIKSKRTARKLWKNLKRSVKK